MASGLCDGSGGPALGDPRVSEEVENGDQDAEAEIDLIEAGGATEKGADAMSERDFELVEGSGNVFRDLGDPDADLKQAKAILAARNHRCAGRPRAIGPQGRRADPLRRGGLLAHSQRRISGGSRWIG